MVFTGLTCFTPIGCIPAAEPHAAAPRATRTVARIVYNLKMCVPNKRDRQVCLFGTVAHDHQIGLGGHTTRKQSCRADVVKRGVRDRAGTRREVRQK